MIAADLVRDMESTLRRFMRKRHEHPPGSYSRFVLACLAVSLSRQLRELRRAT